MCLSMVTFCDLNLTWSELSIKNSLNQFLHLWFRNIWREFWPKTAIYEVSMAPYLKNPDFDLWPDLDLTRDLILKI